MIKDVLVPELSRRFAGLGSFTGTPPEPIAIFPAKHPDVGNVTVYDDGDEATVRIEKITHGHFSSYDESLSEAERDRWVTKCVFDFLDDLFADKVLLWVSESGRSGGWKVLRESLKPADVREGGDIRFFVWSGPVESEERGSDARSSLIVRDSIWNVIRGYLKRRR
jgi:hypothetical protein